MDPKTGDILAMASWPSFDPNRPIEPATGRKRTPEFNSAYMSALEPGSTFKILSLAKALDEGVVQPNEDYYCRGTMTVGKTTIACDREHGSHGLIDPKMAIARSCNLAAATWAMRVGQEDFYKFIRQTGLLEKPGLGLPRESIGLYNEKEYAKQLQLANNGFGQSLNATPLALCAAFASLANEGKRVHPRLVAKVGEMPTPINPGSQVVSAESAQTVLRMMRAVLESDRGTGKSLRIPGYAIGGKTGTAQKKNFDTGSMKGGGYVSNFIGFVPAEKPEAVVLVMVDNPKGGSYYGSTVAGPAFKSIAQSVIRRLRIPPTVALSDPEPAPRVVAEKPNAAAPQPAAKKPKAPSVTIKAKPVSRVADKNRAAQGPPAPAAKKRTTPKDDKKVNPSR
jgi:cell division protein FtsI/penicillin-binding protein 2